MLRSNLHRLRHRYLQNLAVYKTTLVESSADDVNIDVFNLFKNFDSDCSSPSKLPICATIKPKKFSRLILDVNSSQWRLATYAENRLKSTPTTDFLKATNSTIHRTAFTCLPEIYNFKIKTYKNNQFKTEQITNSKSKNQHKFLRQLAVYRKVITNPRKTFIDRDRLLIYKKCLPSGKPMWWKKSMDHQEYQQANFGLFMQSEGTEYTGEVTYENLEDALYEMTFKHFFNIELTRQFLPKYEENIILQENKDSVRKFTPSAITTAERVFMNKLTDAIRKKRRENIIDITESTDVKSEKKLVDFLVIERIEELRKEKARVEELAKIARERFCEKKQRRINLRKLGLDRENVETLFDDELLENDHFEEFVVDSIKNLGTKQLFANLEVRGYFKKTANSKKFNGLSFKKKHAFCQNWLIEYFEGLSVVDDDIYLNEVDFEKIDRKIYSEREVSEIMAAKMIEEGKLAEIIQQHKLVQHKNSCRIINNQVTTPKYLKKPRKFISLEKCLPGDETEDNRVKNRRQNSPKPKTHYYENVRDARLKLKSIADDIIGHQEQTIRQNTPKVRISRSSNPSAHKFSQLNEKRMKRKKN